MTQTTPQSDLRGGETRGGKTCCSRGLLQGLAVDLADALYADGPLKATQVGNLAYTVTLAVCVVTIACSQCGAVHQVEIASPEF
jgi:hypothetical protein